VSLKVSALSVHKTWYYRDFYTWRRMPFHSAPPPL